MGRQPVLRLAVLDLLKQYNIRLTVRQLFYRLVSSGVLRNTEGQYNTLDRTLSDNRKAGHIPFSAFEDRTRNFVGGEGFNYDEPNVIFESAKSEYESATETFQDCHELFNLPLWYGQPKYVEVWVEKDALSGIFQQVTNKYNIRLAPCRGYPSLSFLYKGARHFDQVPEDKEILILYFGDFDMRGLDIERNITETLATLSYSNVEVHRCALTKDQIATYNLLPQPSKKLDTMARGWIESHGDVAWELDALEPNVLMEIIEDSIKEYFDLDIADKRRSAIMQAKNAIREKIGEYLTE